MKLPSPLRESLEWTFIGPMGPEVPTSLLAHSLLGVDGGAAWSSRLDVWVGDADSYLHKVTCPHIFKHPTSKAISDLGLAFELLKAEGPYKLHMWGLLGGRKDHELFNLGESLAFLERHQESQILYYDEAGRVMFHLLGAGEWKFLHQGLFSLGSIDKVSLKMLGDCEYPILRETKLAPLSSMGLSNKGFGEISILNEGPIFLFFPEGRK